MVHRHGTPEIFNTDQGSRFSSLEFTQLLKDKGIAISIDGMGCLRENMFVERLWKSITHKITKWFRVADQNSDLSEIRRLMDSQQKHATPCAKGLAIPLRFVNNLNENCSYLQKDHSMTGMTRQMVEENGAQEGSPAASAASRTPRFKSEDLFQQQREVEIDHQGRIYRLRLTQMNKLILTA